jgi:hypothetical protein
MRGAHGSRRLRAGGLLAAALMTAGLTSVSAPAASADPDVPFESTGSATIHLAKLDQTSTGTGTFSGTVDLATGDVTGEAELGTTETSFDIFGLTAATIAVAVEPTTPFRAHIDLSTFEITASLSFDIRIVYIRPLGIEKINLVSNRCATGEPTDIDVTGTVDLATFTLNASGEFEIPRFRNCGIATGLINALVAGPGNTFTSGPAPALAAAPAP